MTNTPIQYHGLRIFIVLQLVQNHGLKWRDASASCNKRQRIFVYNLWRNNKHSQWRQKLNLIPKLQTIQILNTLAIRHYIHQKFESVIFIWRATNRVWPAQTISVWQSDGNILATFELQSIGLN